MEQRGLKKPCHEYNGQNKDFFLDRGGKVSAKGASPLPAEQGISIFSPHI